MAITIRTDWRVGDLGAVVSLHAAEYLGHGFDETFEAYVAGPLAEFVLHRPPRGRIWLAEEDGRLVGCIAIVPAKGDEAQLRWFLVASSQRGRGLGRRLLDEALGFAREAGYGSVMLWTVSCLERAAELYRRAGFTLVTEKPGAWGAEVLEQQYRLSLG